MDKKVFIEKYIKRLCRNIEQGRFNWRKHCTPRTYFGIKICVTPLFCSYGQIGYTVNFPERYDMPKVDFDWELNTLIINTK